MKKNDIFTFTASNGVEITGVALYAVTLFDGEVFIGNKWICYSQNRLFTLREFSNGEYMYDDMIVDDVFLPKYDKILEAYSDHQVTLAEEQSGM